MNSYKDLFVWQRSMDLVESIYRITALFPTDERFGLISQMRRAAVSIPANIAEGRRRGTRRDYHHFVVMAYGSGAELETHLEISRRLNFVSDEGIEQLSHLLTEVMKMLNSLSSKLREPTSVSD